MDNREKKCQRENTSEKLLEKRILKNHIQREKKFQKFRPKHDQLEKNRSRKPKNL